MFDDPDISAELAELYHTFAAVPAEKASNNIVLVCKTHIICLIEKISIIISTTSEDIL